MVKIIAKALWLVPILMFVYSFYLLRAGLDQKSTADGGFQTTAEVTNVDVGQRSEITYGEMDLEFVDSEGNQVAETLPLPLSLLFMVRDEKTVEITYDPESSKPVVINRISRALWRMSLINALICLVSALLLVIPVFAWNRYLKKHGDPGSAHLS